MVGNGRNAMIMETDSKLMRKKQIRVQVGWKNKIKIRVSEKQR